MNAPDLFEFHNRAYILGDAVQGIAEALQRDTDNDHGVRLGAALELIGEAVAQLALDIEGAEREEKVSK